MAVRESITYATTHPLKAPRFVRHLARGNATLCGVKLGRAIADPPTFQPEGIIDCTHNGCAQALATTEASA